GAFAQLVECWNTKNAVGFAQPFTDDADFVAINGTHIQGRAMIERGHQHLFTTLYQDSLIELAVTHIRASRPDVALVHVQNLNRWKRGEQTGAQAQWARKVTCVVHANAIRLLAPG